MRYEVIVVGAGPGGATAARELAGQGARVLLLEASRLPRYKPCAGGITAKAAALLDDDFREVVQGIMRHAVFSHGFRHEVRASRCEPYAYTVMRDRFDMYLVRKAVEAGAVLHEGERVERAETGPSGVEVVTDRGKYCGDYVVGADGARSRVARSLGLCGSLVRGMAVEAVLNVLPREEARFKETAYIDYGCIKSGYGWIFPKNGRLSVGIGTFAAGRLSLRGLFNRYLGHYFPSLPPNSFRLAGHELPLGGWRQQLVRERALLVGDAAGLADPFTGEGIYYALRSGILAARAIAGSLSGKGEPGLYQRLVEEEIYPELKAAARIASIFYLWPRFFHRLVVARGRVMDAFLEVVAGDRSYRQFGRWMRLFPS